MKYEQGDKVEIPLYNIKEGWILERKYLNDGDVEYLIKDKNGDFDWFPGHIIVLIDK